MVLHTRNQAATPEHSSDVRIMVIHVDTQMTSLTAAAWTRRPRFVVIKVYVAFEFVFELPGEPGVSEHVAGPIERHTVAVLAATEQHRDVRRALVDLSELQRRHFGPEIQGFLNVCIHFGLRHIGCVVSDPIG